MDLHKQTLRSLITRVPERIFFEFLSTSLLVSYLFNNIKFMSLDTSFHNVCYTNIKVPKFLPVVVYINIFRFLFYFPVLFEIPFLPITITFFTVPFCKDGLPQIWVQTDRSYRVTRVSIRSGREDIDFTFQHRMIFRFFAFRIRQFLNTIESGP